MSGASTVGSTRGSCESSASVEREDVVGSSALTLPSLASVKLAPSPPCPLSHLVSHNGLPCSLSTYIPVTTQGYWEIPSDGIAIDGTIVPGTSFKAAIDTGTTLIYIPRAAAKALYAKLGGTEKGSSGEWTVPCASTFSSIALSFGGRQFQMPLRDVFLGCKLASCLGKGWWKGARVGTKLTSSRRLPFLLLASNRRLIVLYRQVHPRNLRYRSIRCRGKHRRHRWRLVLEGESGTQRKFHRRRGVIEC